MIVLGAFFGVDFWLAGTERWRLTVATKTTMKRKGEYAAGRRLTLKDNDPPAGGVEKWRVSHVFRGFAIRCCPKFQEVHSRTCAGLQRRVTKLLPHN